MKTKSNSVNFVNIVKVFQIVLYLWKTMSRCFYPENMDILSPVLALEHIEAFAIVKSFLTHLLLRFVSFIT